MHATYEYQLSTQQLTQQMVGEYVIFFKITHPVNLLLHEIKLCSFTNLINQKFSDSAVMLAIVVSKCCT